MAADDSMQRIDTLLSHLWMVRTFLKHSEEAEEDEELRDVHRGLYDYMLALGAPLEAGDAAAYLKQAGKKYSKLKKAAELFLEIQPEVSSHTNFKMAARSLTAVVDEIGQVLSGGAE
jgi:hypothetical protein